MNGRLVALTVSVPVAILVATVFPPVGLVASVLVPAAALAAALRGGEAGWILAMLPGAAAVAATGPAALPAYVASAMAGPVVARTRRAGFPPGRALVWGAVPFAAWTAALALSGFQPFPEGAAAQLEELWSDPRLATVSPEQAAELRASSQATLEVLRRTWVGFEIVSFWGVLVVAWWFLGKLGARSAQPGLGNFDRLDVSDAWVGALIVGLALVLVGEKGPRVLSPIGSNLLVVSGFVFALRGVAIETFWMRRAGWRRPVRAVALVAGFLLALPFFVAVAGGLGLFDAWIDVRRIRGAASDAPSA